LGGPESVACFRMEERIADLIVQRLGLWGVKTIYGYPGETINPILDALGRADGGPLFIQARHEETAALMASGHPRFTGELGVCLSTAGPGAIHLLNGLYDARLDHQPVLAICGFPPQSTFGTSYQQEVDLRNLFKDVAGEYVELVTNPLQMPNALDRAVRTAVAMRTVSCLILPTDVQEAAPPSEPPREHYMAPGGAGYQSPVVIPREADLDRAAEILNAGQRVALLVGQGARGAGSEVREVADRLGAGLAKALLGKDVVPDTLPYVTGAIGLLGTAPSTRMMRRCDTLLMVGSSFPYSEFLPQPGQARGIQIDIDPRMIGIRYPMELNLVGDSGATLRALLPRLTAKTEGSWRSEIEAEVRGWRVEMARRAEEPADPLNPQLAVRELAARLPDDAIVCADSGSVTYWYARHVEMRPGMTGAVSGALATMGCALPYALAAKESHPHQPVIALVGDGAMQMNGINELITVAHRQQGWADPRLVVMVVHNNDLNEVTWLMRMQGKMPKYEPSQTLPDFDFASFARILGLEGIRVDGPDQVAAACERALTCGRPAVLDVLSDPTVALVSPQVTDAMVSSMAEALERGDPDERRFGADRFRRHLSSEGFPVDRLEQRRKHG
jgi:pyruvate dehydrogenase (quinone)